MKHSELHKAHLENLREQVVRDVLRYIEKSGSSVIELRRPIFFEAVDDQVSKVVEAIHQDQTISISYLGDLETTSFSEVTVEFLITMLEAIENEGYSLISGN